MFLGFNDGSARIVSAMRAELTNVYSVHSIKRTVSSDDCDANDLHA